MAGFILTSDPRNHYQNHVIVGGGNFIQEGPYGMSMPTPYGMVNPGGYGMVIPAPCVQMGTRRHPYRPQNNRTDYSDRYSPCLEERPDNTQLVRRKPVQNETYKLNDCTKYIENLGKEIVSDSKKEFTNFVKQFDSYELKKKRDSEQEQREKERKERKEREERKENARQALWDITFDGIGKEYSSTRLFKALQYANIPGDRSQAILDAVNKSWCISDTEVYLILYGNEQPKRETTISTRGGNCLKIHVHENGLWNLEWERKAFPEGIGKEYSSTLLFKALQYTEIPGETSQTILDAVNKSWCISDTQVNLIFYGNEQPKRETTISTRGGNRLIIHVHENGLWNLEWERKAFPEAIGKEYSRGHLFRGLQYTQIPGETSQAILEAVNQSWCISDTQVTLIFYGTNQPKQQIKISENGSNILNIHVHENGSWELEWVVKTCTKECMDGLTGLTTVFPFDYISGGFNLLSFLFTSKK